MPDAVRGQWAVIVLGTDPTNPRGGIAVAIPGYCQAAEIAGLFEEFIPTYHRNGWSGKWKPALKAIPRLRRAVLRIRQRGDKALVWAHSGAWPSIFRETILCGVAKMLGAQTMMQLHTPNHERYLASAIGRAFLRVAMQPIDRLGVLTGYWARRFAEAGIVRPTAILPNPLPTACVTAASDSNRVRGRDRDGTGLLVLIMTRLVPGKGVELAISALMHLPREVHLTVAGDGSQKRDYERLVRDLGLADRVRFLGWVSGERKEAVLDDCDVFCLPTTADSFGMGFVEAMSHSKPVVGVRWGAIPDVVPDGRVGRLADRPEARAVAECIEFFKDAGVRVAYGREARRWVLEAFAPAVVGERLRQFLEGAMEPRSIPSTGAA